VRGKHTSRFTGFIVLRKRKPSNRFAMRGAFALG
jgi:hypothetical protein